MKDRILAIKRTPGGLVAVLSRRQHDFWKALYNDDLVELVEMYAFVEEPVTSIPSGDIKGFKNLADAWQAVARTQRWDADLLRKVLKILLNTMPVFPEKNLHLPVLDLEAEPPLPKKTAANPRGLRARKGKKQKPKALPETDLRPYLCDPKNVTAILNKLKPFWAEAVTRLQKQNPKLFCSNHPPVFSAEPYLAFRHPGSGNIKRTELPRPFVQYLLFWLSDLPWKKVKPFLSLYHELGLGQDDTLLGAAARLMASCPPEQALTWLQITRDLPVGKRYSILLTLLETDAYDLDFALYPPQRIRELCDMIPQEYLEARLEEMFWTFNAKVSLEYLAGGFQLAEKYGWNKNLQLKHDCPDYPAKEAMDFIQRLEKKYPWVYFDLWRWFGQWDELKSIILRPEWKRYSPGVALDIIQFLLNLVRDKSPKPFHKDTIQFVLNTIDSALKSIPPDNQSDFMSDLDELEWSDMSDSQLKKELKLTCDLLQRFCQKGCGLRSFGASKILNHFIHFTRGESRKIFLNAPDSSFMKLKKACRNDNHHRLVRRGLLPIVQQIPDFAVNLFMSAPVKLFSTAKTLGTLPFPQRQKLVKRLARHPLLKVGLDKISPKQLFRIIKKYRHTTMPHPVPKKLQEYCKEAAPLSDGRIQGYHEKTKSKFLPFVLDVLGRHILESLSRFHPAAREKENWEHTLQFLNLVESNRRGLKNFLKAYFGGDNHYVENHPETKKWFAKHKKINKDLWNQGILFCRRTEKYGPVRIELESDPLEILKMGTYVGSCLSLGGSYSYSAVAVLLDLNKQVLYARDQNNRVLGRQLVALSEKDELVCYEVYPQNVRNVIKNLFFEYDIDFATALNIDLYEGSKDPDKYFMIDRILSEDWWDDGAWYKIAPDS